MKEILQQLEIDEGEAVDKIDEIRESCRSHDEKVATRIVSLLMSVLLNVPSKPSESN
jgi:hypothetical protein